MYSKVSGSLSRVWVLSTIEIVALLVKLFFGASMASIFEQGSKLHRAVEHHTSK